MQLFLDGTRARDGETQGYVRQFGAQAREGVEQRDDALLGDEAPRVGDNDLGVLAASRPFVLVAVVRHGRILRRHRVVPDPRGLDPEVAQPLVAVA